MKIKTISRSEVDHTRDCKRDLQKVHRNLDPKLHPFEKAREYTRALNATKLDKVFAKPFVGALDGHMDGVNCVAASPTSLSAFLSGSCDGEIRLWDLSHRRTVWSVFGHTGHVRGLAVMPSGEAFFSCGDDGTVKQWGLGVAAAGDTDEPEPLAVYNCPGSLLNIDHHWSQTKFVTAGDCLNLWDHTRSEPIKSYSWGSDTVTCARFNPAETSLVVSAGSDRALTLYDIRQEKPLHKLVMAMRSNGVCWNPMEAFNFTVANEDFNLYTFDMRKFARPMMVHKDHVGAVMDVSYSPTGREFVSGSYDRTVRIWEVNKGNSREIYHTKRMQRVWAVRYTANAKFVVSGSDDAIVRVWKAQASKSLAKLDPRAQRKMNYLGKLKERYKDVPDLKRIAKHRQQPKYILKAREEAATIKAAKKVKASNRRKNSAPGMHLDEEERVKPIIKELD